MKTWMLALSLIAVLGMTGLADAKNKGKDKGTKGKIETVAAGSFTMTVGHKGKKNANAAAAQSMTVKFDATTLISINGAAGGKIGPSMVGKHVIVTGGTNGNTITATKITISDGKKGKKKNAA